MSRMLDLSVYPDLWLREARGGWGYVTPIPCRFLSRTDKRVKVLALKANGLPVVRYIAPDSFRAAAS